MIDVAFGVAMLAFIVGYVLNVRRRQRNPERADRRGRVLLGSYLVVFGLYLGYQAVTSAQSRTFHIVLATIQTLLGAYLVFDAWRVKRADTDASCASS